MPPSPTLTVDKAASKKVGFSGLTKGSTCVNCGKAARTAGAIEALIRAGKRLSLVNERAVPVFHNKDKRALTGAPARAILAAL